MKLNRDFFERDTIKVAKDLLGKYLVRELRENRNEKRVIIGKIVETEAYIGEDDLACHASKGKTKRTEIMYGKAGHAYVYMIYGMYHCLNIVTEKEGFPAAVLIRALEPVWSDGQTLSNMVKDSQKNSQVLTNSDASESEKINRFNPKLSSGPGKFCRWMEITRELNGVDITKSDELYIVDKIDLSFEPKVRSLDSSRSSRTVKNQDDFEIVEKKRIGVDYAKHCALHPWRFYIKNNPSVSKK